MAELKFRLLDLNQAENFVRKTPNTWWENYDIVIWNPSPGGWSKKNGRFHNNQWGIAKRIVVTNDGLWKVPNSVRPSR
jgi:hypothetical protein